MRLAAVCLCLCSSWVATGYAQTDDEDRARALVFFRGAQEAYEAGEFERSVMLLETAITLHDIASLHYNLARALHELGRWERARDEYRVYLEMEPDSDQRARIEARLVVIERTLERQRARNTASPPQIPEPRTGVVPSGESEPTRRPTAAWAVFATGATVLAAGTVAGGLARSAINDARDASDHIRAVERGGAAERRALAANVLFIAGGAASLAGLVWALVAKRRGAVRPDVGVGTLGLHGRF